jgi:hypothetical protein
MLLVAPPAAAEPPWPVPGTESAADTIRDLQSQGHRVGINRVFGYTRSIARQVFGHRGSQSRWTTCR